MKYERKSPFSDGFNDLYDLAGVGADDYWERKHLLLGSGGGGSGGSGGNDNDNDETSMDETQDTGFGSTPGPGPGIGSPGDPDSQSPGPTGNDPDGVTGFGSTPGIGSPSGTGGPSGVPGDPSIGADPSMGQPGSGFGGISAGPPGSNADAEAEAAAIGAAMGESQSYANNISLSPGRQGLNALIGLIGLNYGREHDEFGRGIDNLSFSPMSAISAAMGLGPMGSIAVAGLESLGRGFGFDTHVSVNEFGNVSTTAPGPGSIGDAVANAVGVDTSPGGLSHGNTSLGVGIGSLGTGGPSSTDDLGGFGVDAAGDSALDTTSVLAQDVNPFGDAQPAAAALPTPALPSAPINTGGVGTSGFNVVPTTRPFVNQPLRQPVPLQTPFFQQPNFQPFARPMRYGGAVHGGIGSMLQIR